MEMYTENFAFQQVIDLLLFTTEFAIVLKSNKLTNRQIFVFSLLYRYILQKFWTRILCRTKQLLQPAFNCSIYQ